MKMLRGKKVMFCFVYNEIKYLPDVIRYYDSNGIKSYIIDNMSDDGTWEWLQENNIPSHRFDTGESFHLSKLQEELIRTIHKIQPLWIIYAAADFYYIAKDLSLSDMINKVDKDGYNRIKMKCYLMLNTGEHYDIPLRKHYFYCKPDRHLTLIVKYDKSLRLMADKIITDNMKQVFYPGVMINYGGCKTKEESDIKYKRRVKAWEEGLRSDYGYHYREGKALNWLYDKKDLIDIRETELIEYINKIEAK